MKILWFTWKDKENPASGGAEVVAHEIAKRLIKEGHEIIFITAGFPGSVSKSNKYGYKVVRLGNKWTVYPLAFLYYKKHLKNWPDVVIDEYQAIPFFTKLYVRQSKFLFVHQLARNLWFYQMFFPINFLGYVLEPLFLKFISNQKVITISESTKQDLIKYGFKNENIKIISEGIEIDPIKDLSFIKKNKTPTLLSLGSIRPMKRTDHIIKAFEIAKQEKSNLELVIVGGLSGKYGNYVLNLIKKSPFESSIHYLGPVSLEKK